MKSVYLRTLLLPVLLSRSYSPVFSFLLAGLCCYQIWLWTLVISCLNDCNSFLLNFASTPVSSPCTCTHVICPPHKNQSNLFINGSQTRLLVCSKHCRNFPALQIKVRILHGHLLFTGPEMLFYHLTTCLTPSLHLVLSTNVPSIEKLISIPKMAPHPIRVYLS